MPVIISLASDPADLVMQGEEMRLVAIASGVGGAPAMASVQMLDAAPLAAPLVAGLQGYPPMHPDYTPYAQLRNAFAGTLISNNACISTPCGAAIPFDRGNALQTQFKQADVRWQLVGVTRDNAGSALGSCRVIVMEAGRLTVASAPIVAEAISDGSGNFAIEAPLNTAYQVISYKSGSPDVAGASLNTLTPVAL